MSSATETIENLVNTEYKYGFVSHIETDAFLPGLNEEVIRKISAKKAEPDFMLDWRLKAFRHWLTMKEPHWSNAYYPPLNYQDFIYYAAPVRKPQLESLDQVDPEVLRTFNRL